MNDLILIRPDLIYANQIMEYRREFIELSKDENKPIEGGGTLQKFDNADEWIEYSKIMEKGEDLPENLVSATQLILIRKSDEKMIGLLQIRHSLNEFLKKYGGHIGYSIAPSERKKGYGTKMLNMALPLCRDYDISNVLITCVDGNIGSKKIIMANGGIYENTIYDEMSKKNLERYWINLDGK